MPSGCARTGARSRRCTGGCSRGSPRVRSTTGCSCRGCRSSCVPIVIQWAPSGLSGPGRHDGRQLGPLGAGSTSARARPAARACAPIAKRAHQRRIHLVADRDREDLRLGPSHGEVVELHLGHVDDEAPRRRVGQHVLGREPHDGARIRDPDRMSRVAAARRARSRADGGRRRRAACRRSSRRCRSAASPTTRGSDARRGCGIRLVERRGHGLGRRGAGREAEQTESTSPRGAGEDPSWPEARRTPNGFNGRRAHGNSVRGTTRHGRLDGARAAPHTSSGNASTTSARLRSTAPRCVGVEPPSRTRTRSRAGSIAMNCPR